MPKNENAERELYKEIIEQQAARIKEQETTIVELRELVGELRLLKANLEETLCEFNRQLLVQKVNNKKGGRI